MVESVPVTRRQVTGSIIHHAMQCVSHVDPAAGLRKDAAYARVDKVGGGVTSDL